MLFGTFFNSGKNKNVQVIKLSSCPHLLYHSYPCVTEESALEGKKDIPSKAEEHYYMNKP